MSGHKPFKDLRNTLSDESKGRVAEQYTTRLNRILAEFGRDPHQMAIEIEALRRGE